MVKIEHCDEGDAASAGAGAPRGGAMDPRRPDPTRAIVKAEEELDSFSEKRLYLMRKMRFSKREVDLAFSELGEGASVGRLVDWIVTAQEATTEGQQLPRPIQSRKMAKVENCDEGDVASADAGAPRGGAVEPRQPDPTCAIVKVEASQNAGSQSSTSLGSLFNSDDEGNGVSSMPRIEASRDTEELDSFSKKRSYLLSRMSFSKKEVDSAFSELGEGVSIDRLVNWIVTAQEATTEGNAEFLPAQMDKLLSLLQMGFTQQEVSSAIEAFGQEATIEELADSIFARRFTDTTVQNQVIDESDFPSERETGYSIHHQRLGFYDDEDDYDFRAKKAKHECLEMTSSLGRNRTIRGDLAKPPYFLYADLVGISKDTWDQLSTFLFNIQPEYLNSQSFSALTRREGYVHNLPTERRHVLLPRSPMTIQGALPLTRKFWPSWDTRKQIAGVSSDAARGVEQIREKLEKAIKDSQGILSEGKQAQIVQQCKMASLVWIGQDKLGPLQPHQMEVILGYPPKHTDLPGLNPRDRVAAMEFAFQIDTLAHPLSVLKDLYPGGLRVLSIYSGVGGAEVALHRLGIPLRCVVSVEESAVNRRILKSWWGKTEQDGELRQLPNVRNLNSRVLEEMMKEFGGFDLVIGGNYRPYKGGTNTVGATMGMDSSHFFEYVRVVQSVRKHAGS